MSEKTYTQDRQVVTATIRLLLEGADLISFKYDSGFTVDFQHSVEKAKGNLPVQLSLVLRAVWWAGANADIPLEFSKGSDTLRVRPECPYQAFKLTSFIGFSVDNVEIMGDGTLVISLSNGETVHVSGTEKEWDYSWYLFAPSSFAGSDAWSINCDARGDLDGSWPKDANIPEQVTFRL